MRAIFGYCELQNNRHKLKIMLYYIKTGASAQMQSRCAGSGVKKATAHTHKRHVRSRPPPPARARDDGTELPEPMRGLGREKSHRTHPHAHGMTPQSCQSRCAGSGVKKATADTHTRTG